MAGFDLGGVYNFEIGGATVNDGGNELSISMTKNLLKKFIKEFSFGDFNYKYRDQLKRNYNLKLYYLDVEVEDVLTYDEELGKSLQERPAEFLLQFEAAAKDIADEITRPRPADESVIQDVQVMLNSSAHTAPMRDLRSGQVSRLVRTSGIVISASSVRSKATLLTLQCRGCRAFQSNIPVRPGLEGLALPRKCPTDSAAAGRDKCPLDPYFIVPDKCHCVDYQLIKVQESPEDVPQGEMPRHILLYCDRWLCDKVVPGNRVDVLGVFCIKRQVATTRGNAKERFNVGVKAPYIRALGMRSSTAGSGGRAPGKIFTDAEEEEMRRMASQPDIFNTLARSIAPSIFGSLDIKKAIVCLLVAGSRKKLPDGLYRRGDINILMLGDPGTAKSQLLKFVERCSPIAVYTSGKGSSAAGLTASVIRDPHSRSFIMEGGAMVLADGGVVCIDEFDKMREDDRVAIHEAMEQQTISIAKAGITTTLNSRCAVLAAANSVFGRWDDTKGAENIDFMPTILSRFDMIFVVKDEHDETRDIQMAKHVMQVHLRGAAGGTSEVTEGEISLEKLRRFITFCRTHCGPRLSERAAEKLKNRYVLLRNGADEAERESGKRGVIPITVRQLEAIVRISESLAKMRLAAFATEDDVEEALRLFQVSTVDAASTGNLSGAEGFTTQEDLDVLINAERQVKRRFVIGSQVSEQVITSELAKQGFTDRVVGRVLNLMLRRGELQHRMQRRILYRVK